MKSSPLASQCLLHFLLFNICFFCLQLVLIFSQAGSFISAIKLPWEIYLQFFITFGIHITLYLLLSLFQTLLVIGIMNRSWHYFSPEQWQIIIWILSICALLGANIYYFPLSVFSKLFSPPITPFYINILLQGSLFGLSLLLLNGLLYRKILFFVPLLIPGFLIYSVMNQPEKLIQNISLDAKPNIIILGIDSLSPESVNQENMPFLSKLLKTSVQFKNTISPLARTYPAWCSILTGLYAEHHHAEENLVAKNSVASTQSIVWNLNKQGYYGIFATDDRRFNSLDKDFGFKKIIGPKLGVNDVLLGSFNDFPLSNLLINFRIGSWLFPYNYINRASYFSYYPETFDAKLQKELNQPNTPVFFAVHFTLPHWPYAWAESSPEQVNNEFSLKKRSALYQTALQRVDKQLNSLFSFLEQHHYLTNSLVIILSDHGEALYYPDSRLTNYHNYQGTLPSKLIDYFKNNTATDLDKSAGHGSDILSPKQYHSIMAVNIYENGQLITPASQIKTRTALIDLAPTILAYLNTTHSEKMDGISLLPSILNPKFPLPKREFYIESGMFPNQNLSKEKAMEIGKKFYGINTLSGEIEIKSNKLKYFDHQKLYGILSEQWVFALYPENKTYIPVIQNLSTGEWTDDMESHFAKASPAALLYQKLQRFYYKKLV